jgi:hypothetical protein
MIGLCKNVKSVIFKLTLYMDGRAFMRTKYVGYLHFFIVYMCVYICMSTHT